MDITRRQRKTTTEEHLEERSATRNVGSSYRKMEAYAPLGATRHNPTNIVFSSFEHTENEYIKIHNSANNNIRQRGCGDTNIHM